MASNTKGSKAATQAARARAAELKAQERRANQRRTLLVIVGAVAVVVAFYFVILYIVNSSKIEIYDSGEFKAPSAADESGGFLIGQDGTLGGSVPSDAVRVDLYVDPLCPVCHAFEQLNGDGLLDLRERGLIAYYVHPISILNRFSAGTQYPTRAVSALATVSEYDPAHFEAFLAALYDHQPEENSPGLTNEEIADVAREAGVTEDAIAKIPEGEFTQWVAKATELASIDGMAGTPTVFVNKDTDHLDLGADVWANAGVLSFTLGFIHENGVQAYLDAVAAAQEAGANPSPSAST